MKFLSYFECHFRGGTCNQIFGIFDDIRVTFHLWGSWFGRQSWSTASISTKLQNQQGRTLGDTFIWFFAMLFSQTALYALPRPVQGFSETIGNSQSRATVPDGLAEHFGSFFWVHATDPVWSWSWSYWSSNPPILATWTVKKEKKKWMKNCPKTQILSLVDGFFPKNPPWPPWLCDVWVVW